MLADDYRKWRASSVCAHCRRPIGQVDGDVWIDETGGDVCGWDGGNEPHEPRHPEIRIGDRVRSHHFEFARERQNFITGHVRGYCELDGCLRYAIEAESETWAGEVKPMNANVYPPINGTRTWMGGVCDGVEHAPRAMSASTTLTRRQP